MYALNLNCNKLKQKKIYRGSVDDFLSDTKLQKNTDEAKLFENSRKN